MPKKNMKSKFIYFPVQTILLREISQVMAIYKNVEHAASEGRSSSIERQGHEIETF